MTRETVLSNARIVLEDRILDGTLVLRDGLIVDISEGSAAAGEDMEGDFLIPGLVELHTDHLEAHYSPRPGVRWGKTAAIQAHDAQVVTSGITTVFDCLRMGADEDGGFEKGEMRAMADAIAEAQAEEPRIACARSTSSTCAARSRRTTCSTITRNSRMIRWSASSR
jgi:alpha-D-ribose 1-methylphosphonate 5-triphosphate diphosphatase